MLMAHGSVKYVPYLLTNLSSMAFDYCVRQKMGGLHLSYGVLNQVPVLPPATYMQATPWSSGKMLAEWLLPRVLELTYTAWDLQPFAIDCGLAKDAPPFRWDEARRFLLRCELDAAYFHLYLRREKEEQAGNYTHADKCADVAYIMDSFPIVRRKDEERWGSYRTKETILTIFDAMARAEKDKSAYITLLDPPPADPLVAHPPRESR